MNARIALATALVTAGLACGGSEPQPNLVLISIDTLRADHTSLYGYPRNTTPELARLASGGALFSAAYAPTSSTAPTHASLFTSLLPLTHGVVENGLVLPPAFTTLAERLRASGYQTAALVSSFVLKEKFGCSQGFDLYDDDFDLETATTPAEIWAEFAAQSTAGAAMDRSATETTRRALAWLRETRDSDRPFFLFVHYFDPHSPYTPPSSFASRFSGDGTPLSEKIARYDAEIAYTDSEMARLLTDLEPLGLERNTLVAITADHGEGLMDRGYLNHGIHLYEELVRVPLLIRWPGVIAPVTIDAPVGLVDLAPTLLDLLGVAFEPGSMRGRNLAPALRGEQSLDDEHPIFLQRRRYAGAPEMFAVRVGDWKYIENGPRRELFNLEADPDEQVNMHVLAHPIAARLKTLLDEWLRGEARADEDPASVGPEDRERLRALGYVE